MVLATGLWAQPAIEPSLTESQFQQRLGSIKARASEPERLKLAKQLLLAPGYSSVQIKEIAKTFSDENVRLEYALAAFNFTRDRENFYEVYDAFSSFSKVLRLHEAVKTPRPGVPQPAGNPPPPVTEEELAQVKNTLRKEDFDKTRVPLAKQILSGKPRFLAHQVRDLLRLFDFEPARLEVAKFGYDCTLDKDNYFLVYDAFDFPASKQELRKHLESRVKGSNYNN
jgi:hypothetical protein